MSRDLSPVSELYLVEPRLQEIGVRLEDVALNEKYERWGIG